MYADEVVRGTCSNEGCKEEVSFAKGSKSKQCYKCRMEKMREYGRAYQRKRKLLKNAEERCNKKDF